MGTWIAVVVATAALLGIAGLRSARRRRRPPSRLSEARATTRALGRDRRARLGRGRRGEGSHFLRTKLNKYGDEHRNDEASSADGGGFDSGGGGGGGSD